MPQLVFSDMLHLTVLAFPVVVEKITVVWKRHASVYPYTAHISTQTRSRLKRRSKNF